MFSSSVMGLIAYDRPVLRAFCRLMTKLRVIAMVSPRAQDIMSGRRSAMLNVMTVKCW